MIGILTEKPSAMRNMSAALGGVSGTYKGEQYVIVAARGHLYELDSPENQVSSALSAQYKTWNIANLPWSETDFKWNRKQKADTKALLSQIKSTLKTCDEICIATDDDPTGEGELLAWEILDGLNLRPKKWTRMYFVDESKPQLQKAFKQRKVLPSMLTDVDYLKADYRSKWDFMSMQWTRIATVLCGNGWVLRQGRLKSAMVVITGDGLKAYNNYAKIPFFQNRFKDENGVMYTNPKEPKYDAKSKVPNTYKASSVVTDSVTRKTTAPPALLDLAGLSAALSTKYKAKTITDTYQKLYEAQIVTYPRTEDKFITPDQFDELLPFVDAIASVVGVDTALLTHKQKRKTHVKTGGAHGANRPGKVVPKSLDSLRSYGACAPDIYNILAHNYLAMLAEDYEYDQYKGHVNDYPDFVGSVNVPAKMGYKLVYSDDDIDVNEPVKALGTVATPYVHEGYPPRAPKPTMKWLMKELEKYDVGTGATRTSIYAEVTSTSAKYPLLVDTKGVLSMTEYGDASYILLHDTHIGSVKITEQLMSEMRDIDKGVLTADVGLHRIQQLIKDDIVTMTNNRKGLNIMSNNTNTSTSTPKEKATGVWKKKQVSFNRTWSGHRFTDDEVADLLAGKEITITGLISAKGTEYGVTGKLANLEYNGAKYVGFERTGFASSNTSIPKSWCGHDFTEDEKNMLELGQAVQLDGCISKKTGNVFSCKVTWTDGKIVPNFG